VKAAKLSHYQAPSMVTFQSSWLFPGEGRRGPQARKPDARRAGGVGGWARSVGRASGACFLALGAHLGGVGRGVGRASGVNKIGTLGRRAGLGGVRFHFLPSKRSSTGTRVRSGFDGRPLSKTWIFSALNRRRIAASNCGERMPWQSGSFANSAGA
jgi:hypothetical protein